MRGAADLLLPSHHRGAALVGPTDPSVFNNPTGEKSSTDPPRDQDEVILDLGCGCGRGCSSVDFSRYRDRAYVSVDLHHGMVGSGAAQKTWSFTHPASRSFTTMCSSSALISVRRSLRAVPSPSRTRSSPCSLILPGHARARGASGRVSTRDCRGLRPDGIEVTAPTFRGGEKGDPMKSPAVSSGRRLFAPF